MQCGHTVIGLESSSSSSFLKFSKNRSNSSSVIILFPFQNILQAVSAALYYLGRISWGVTKCRSLEASLGQQSRQEPTIGQKILFTQDMLLFMEIRPLEILDYILVRFALSDARFARCLGIDENNHVKN